MSSKLAQRAQKLFIQYLRENNLKVTQERLALLDEIFATDEHLDADDLLARMKGKQRKVSRATVYRTLDLLVQCGLVRKSRLGREHYYYEKMEPGGGHHHMVCTATGKIIEFWDAELDERLRRLCQEHKFRPTFISIQIQGLSEEGQKVEQNTSFF
jgi:Fur family ferric uptake transcriptional regulator